MSYLDAWWLRRPAAAYALAGPPAPTCCNAGAACFPSATAAAFDACAVCSRSEAAAYGHAHPGDIAEPASLSAIQLPRTDYPLIDSLRSVAGAAREV